jgi:hypothetical protein
MAIDEAPHRQLASAWALQALMVDLLDPPRDLDHASLLHRLIQALDASRAIVVVGSTLVAGEPALPHNPPVGGQRKYLETHLSPQDDYLRVAADPSTPTGFEQFFAPDQVVEVFPVWRDGKLVAYIAFGSATAIVDVPEPPAPVRVVRAIVRGICDEYISRPSSTPPAAPGPDPPAKPA